MKPGGPKHVHEGEYSQGNGRYAMSSWTICYDFRQINCEVTVNRV